jgi:dynein heavy chain
MDKLETHRVQISIMMNSKYLDAVLRTEPERGIVTFEVEVRHWESELSLVAEAVQLLEEVQDKWKNLSIFFLHKRDVPKALPEATEKFKFLDNKIRAFLTGLSKVKRVIAANHQDEVLTLQLEIFLEELEEGENALMSYAQKKRKTFPPFFFMSLAQVLATLGNEVSPELTEIDSMYTHPVPLATQFLGYQARAQRPLNLLARLS